MSEGWILSTFRISIVNQLIKFASISSSTYLNPRSIEVVGLGHTFPRKWSLNSFTSWAKELTEWDLRWAYYSHADLLKVVGKTRHIKVSDKMEAYENWFLLYVVNEQGSDRHRIDLPFSSELVEVVVHFFEASVHLLWSDSQGVNCWVSWVSLRPNRS